MAEVFISYARPAEVDARRIAEALREAGYGVWRDDELPAHRDYAEVIEERLRAAKAVVVVWSADAVKSQWVRAEADVAREAGTLVQLALDASTLPMPFSRIQCADLAGWRGDIAAPGWRKVADSVAALVRGEGSAPASMTTPAPPAAPVAAEPLLAVLAFDNLSGDPEMAWFSDGVSEEILDAVARGSSLKVISRSSSFQFRGADKAVRRVAADLRATHLLDGSVRRSGQKIRIAARLVECASDTTLMSQRFDRDLDDIFALQDEIAAAVAGALKTAFEGPREAAIDPETFDLFLRAQATSTGALSGDVGHRLSLFGEVTARAPGFARGWAALAQQQAMTLMADRDAATAAGLSRARAVEAARNALRLDPHQGLAWQALAYLEPWAAYQAREALLEKALAASPNIAAVHGRFGHFCFTVGRLHEALSFSRTACQVDPTATWGLIVVLATLRRLDEARRESEALLTHRPGDMGPAMLALRHAAVTQDSAWVEWLLSAVSGIPHEEADWARALASPSPESNQSLLTMCSDELARTGTLVLHPTLWFLCGQGFADEVFDLLDKASFMRVFADAASPFGGASPAAFYDPVLGVYRDRRFPRLAARLGLADYWVRSGKWPDCADDTPYDFRAEIAKAAAEHPAPHV